MFVEVITSGFKKQSIAVNRIQSFKPTSITNDSDCTEITLVDGTKTKIRNRYDNFLKLIQEATFIN